MTTETTVDPFLEVLEDLDRQGREAILENLTDEQRRAVEHPGPLAVIAPPGSGKTRVLTARVLDLARRGEAQATLALTFTRQAANEMRNRLATRLSKEVLDAITIGTFHSVAYGLVRAHYRELGFNREPGVCDPAYSRHLLRRAWREAGQPGDFEALVQTVLAEKGQGRRPQDGDAGKVYEIYENYLRQAGLVDFDDMINLALSILAEDISPIPSTFRHVLVDEFQDTDERQVLILHLIAHDVEDVFAVGDPLQSIYRWRGALPDAFDVFGQLFGGDTFALTRDFRNPSVIARLARRVAAQVTADPPALHPVRDGGSVTIQACEDEAEWVAGEVARLIDEEGRRPTEIAVLGRTHAVIAGVEFALRRAGVPVRTLGESLLHKWETRHILAYLRALLNPEDAEAVRVAVQAPPRLSPSAVAVLKNKGLFTLPGLTRALGDAMVSGEDDLQGLYDFLQVMDDLRDKAVELPLSDLIRYIPQRIGYYEWRERRGDDVRAVARVIDLLASVAEGEPEEIIRMAAQDLGGAGVAVGTVHAAKGLEWPVVFVVGLEEGLFPHHRNLSPQEALAEEYRLFYTAVTRCSDTLYLTHALFRRGRDGGAQRRRDPSRFLSLAKEVADGG